MKHQQQKMIRKVEYTSNLHRDDADELDKTVLGEVVYKMKRRGPRIDL
jgi:hypothetical protein